MMPDDDNEPGCTTMQASSSSPPVMMTSIAQLRQPFAVPFKSILVAGCHYSIYEDSCNACSRSGWMFYVFLKSEQGGDIEGGGLLFILYYYTTSTTPRSKTFEFFSLSSFSFFFPSSTTLNSFFCHYQSIILVHCTITPF
jgi:hypothetical protein